MMSTLRRVRGFLVSCAAALLGCLLSLVGCQESSAPTAQSADHLQENALVRVYFTKSDLPSSDPRHPAQVIARYIREAQQYLDVCAHELDNSIITEALLQAHQRGVRVRVVTETAYVQEKSIQMLQKAGVPVVDDRRDGALMHNKFIVFDQKAVWTGSMNFTDNCTSRNDNHGIYICDERIAANYATKFRWMFENRQFGRPPTSADHIPFPKVTLADGTIIENYFAPHDQVADQIIRQIRRASESLHFLMFSFTHRGIADAILDRARNRVEVLGVLERRQAIAAHSMYSYLASFGPPVQVYLDGNKYNMHHKLLIIDGQTTIAGSFNWSLGADKENDENIVILHSARLAEQFEQEFRRVFDQARSQQ